MSLSISTKTSEHLSPVVAQMILVALPEPVREAFERRAADIDYPVETVLEMALAGFLDSKALSFSDCKPRY